MKKEKKNWILFLISCSIVIIGVLSAIIDATISPSYNMLTPIAIPAALFAGYLAGKEEKR